MIGTPRVPRDIPLMCIGYKYNFQKFLGFIATEESGSNDPGDPYSYCFPGNYSNVYIFPVFWTRVVVSIDGNDPLSVTKKQW